MAVNNAILFNAALNGFLGGTFSGRYLTDPVGADYAPAANAAEAFATAVDAAIPLDAALVTPVDKYTLGHSDMLEQLCNAAANGAYNTDAVSADYGPTASAIAAAYNQSKLKLV